MALSTQVFTRSPCRKVRKIMALVKGTASVELFRLAPQYVLHCRRKSSVFVRSPVNTCGGTPMNLSVALGRAGASPGIPPGAFGSSGGPPWGKPPPPSPPPPPPGGRRLPRKVGRLLRPGKPQLEVGAGWVVAVVNAVRSSVPGGSLMVIVAMLVSMVRDSADAIVSPAVCSVCPVSVDVPLVAPEALARGGSLSSSP